MLVSVLVLDVDRGRRRIPWGPALVPFFVTAAALVVAVDGGATGGGGRDVAAVGCAALVLPCLYLVARRWYLSAARRGRAGLAVAVVLVKPVLGVLLATAPLLFVVWSTTRYVVAPVLPAAP